ncbi:MAG: FecR domain-containing protein [Deltaproteobacteria bacterium]|nr:FecR domain-containing protein [Deltaproteobacteria bacterium]
MLEKREKHCRIAISAVTLLLVVFCCSIALAAVEAGRVTHLSGPLFARKTDGATKTLSKNSIVEQGDVLITERRTYARIKFADNSEVTLRPDTQFKVEAFHYEAHNPKQDKAIFSLTKGALRALTGQVGKRSTADSYKMKTPPAVIGIRGTIYEVKICADNCPGLANGIYFFVPEGDITITNAAGTQTVSAGQYAYARDVNSAPVLLPGNPGIDFVIPGEIEAAGSTGGCIVR